MNNTVSTKNHFIVFFHSENLRDEFFGSVPLIYNICIIYIYIYNKSSI